MPKERWRAFLKIKGKLPLSAKGRNTELNTTKKKPKKSPWKQIMYTIFHFHPLNINSCSTGLSLDFIFCVWNRKRDSHAHNKHTQFLKGWVWAKYLVFGIWNPALKKQTFWKLFCSRFLGNEQKGYYFHVSRTKSLWNVIVVVVWCGGEGIQHTRRKLQGLWN